MVTLESSSTPICMSLLDNFLWILTHRAKIQNYLPPRVENIFQPLLTDLLWLWSIHIFKCYYLFWPLVKWELPIHCVRQREWYLLFEALQVQPRLSALKSMALSSLQKRVYCRLSCKYVLLISANVLFHLKTQYFEFIAQFRS